MSAAVGADVESLCSKCGDVWHVVVAKVGESIVKVQCKQCGGYHRYKNPNPNAAKTPRAPRASAPRAPREHRPVERFETPAVAADLTRAVRTYKVTERFEVGERVEHPSFGQGVVESTTEPGKMTVFFADGRKVLVHDKPRPFDHTKPDPNLMSPVNAPMTARGPMPGVPRAASQPAAPEPDDELEADAP